PGNCGLVCRSSFRRGWKCVSMSLNQGTTTIKNGDFEKRPAEFLSKRVAWARDQLKVNDDNRLLKDISLADPGGLGEGYEKGNLYSYRYEKDAIPADAQLETDLLNLLRKLDRLYASETPPKEQGVEIPAAPTEVAWEELKRTTLWDDRELEELITTIEAGSGQ